jgi:short-subunit dehydrogenase
MTDSQPPVVSSALQPPQGAIVVGASSGIGAALARKLAREGYLVAALGRRADRLNDLCGEINGELGQGRARPYPHDATHYAEAPTLFQTILGDLGQVEVVIYASGLLEPVALSEYHFDKDRAMMEVNLLGAMAWLNQAALLFEHTGGGHVVGLSSIAGERGRVRSPAYNASKAALNSYLESLRNRLTRKGVHVLTVKPGFVDTPMLKSADKKMWVISPEQAADDIWRAIHGRKQTIFTPARWWLVALALRHVPSIIFRRLSI